MPIDVTVEANQATMEKYRLPCEEGVRARRRVRPPCDGVGYSQNRCSAVAEFSVVVAWALVQTFQGQSQANGEEKFAASVRVDARQELRGRRGGDSRAIKQWRKR